MKSLSHVRLSATLWTVAYQASSMGFSRQEYWSSLPFPSPGDHPNPGIEPGSPALEADTLTSEPPGKPQRKDNQLHNNSVNPPAEYREAPYLPACLVSFFSVKLFVTLWTVAYQAPLPMGFSRQDTGVGFHFLLQGIFQTQILNPRLLPCRQIL